MNELNKIDVSYFLEGLRELSERFNIKISGCGCCGSPYLMQLNRAKGTHYVVDDEDNNLEWTT